MNAEGAPACAACGAPLEADDRALGTEPEAATSYGEAVDEASARGRRTPIVVGAVVALVALVAAVALPLLSGDDSTAASDEAGAALRVAAGCAEVEAHPDELVGGGHLQPPEVGTYGTNPPSSGNHYGGSPVGGVFREHVAPEVWLHNLEHGHVIILYRASLAPGVRTALESFVRKRATLAVIAPSSTITGPLAVVAWTRLMRCATPTSADAVTAAIGNFFDAFVGTQSPEGRLPASETTDVPA